jgi:hypothetical protein
MIGLKAVKRRPRTAEKGLYSPAVGNIADFFSGICFAHLRHENVDKRSDH